MWNRRVERCDPAARLAAHFFDAAARVANAGHGGQIVMSDATRAAVAGRLPAGLPVHDLGSYRLKGIPLDIRLHAVVVPGSDDSPAPLRAELVAAPATGD